MKSHLNILSLNINGLREEARRKSIFYWLKQLTFDLILLQDICFQEIDRDQWSREWGLPVLWSPFNAILLLDKGMSITEIDGQVESERCLLGVIQGGCLQDRILVGSIYVPAERQARRRFLTQLPGMLHEGIHLLGGDFNTVANPGLDCFPPKTTRASKDWGILSEKVQQWGLCDLYSVCGHNSPQLTHWQNTQVGAVGSRIDYIFVNSQLAPLFSETQLQVCSFSDHIGVTSQLKLSVDIPRGKGLWRMNCSILELGEVKESMNEMLVAAAAQIKKSGDVGAFGIWEDVKSLIQAADIFHSKRLAKCRR